MKKVQHLLHRISVLTVTALLFVGCSTDNENDMPEPGQELSQAELKTILETDKIAGAVDTVLAELYTNDNSSAKEGAECYEAAYTETGYTATFNNCVLNGTENINGSLTVVYEVQTEQSAAFTATFTDFYVGEIKVNGTRSYSVSAGTEENSISFTIVSDMEVILADDSVISENGTKTLVLSFGDTLESGSIALSGSWTLEIDGTTYVVEVTEDLLGTFGCAHLVGGSMVVGKNGLSVTIDFGDGSCDAIATVLYPNGATEEVNLDE